MNPLLNSLLGFFIIANLIAFSVYWLDKSRARRERQRISEANLLQLAFIGPLGSIFGIWWLRHKTRKRPFLIKYFVVMFLSAASYLGLGYVIYAFG